MAYGAGLAASEEAGLFGFPSIRGAQNVVVGNGDVAVRSTEDAPAVALMEFVAGPKAGDALAGLGGFLPPNRRVNLTFYPDDASRQPHERGSMPTPFDSTSPIFSPPSSAVRRVRGCGASCRSFSWTPVTSTGRLDSSKPPPRGPSTGRPSHSPGSRQRDRRVLFASECGQRTVACHAGSEPEMGDGEVNERVLVVEDDRSVRETVTLLLERAALRVTSVDDGRQALEQLSRYTFDLVLLDVMLPVVDGFKVCREIREESQIPIVMLTARADTADVVAGLELGADDYLTKPFQGPELVARVRAALRRRDSDPLAPRIQIQDLDIDASGFRLTQAGRPVELTATEFRLLVELATNAERVVSREGLLQRVWGYDYLGDSRLVDMAVKRLRDKLGDDPRHPRYITTVRGAGYRLDAG